MNRKIHPEELRGTGLAPSDFELLNGQISMDLADKKGFHPDDQHREHEMKLHEAEKCE